MEGLKVDDDRLRLVYDCATLLGRVGCEGDTAWRDMCDPGIVKEVDRDVQMHWPWLHKNPGRGQANSRTPSASLDFDTTFLLGL